ncbi:MAG: DUF6438 domain-containing protein [Actinomycetota bacterium]
MKSVVLLAVIFALAPLQGRKEEAPVTEIIVRRIQGLGGGSADLLTLRADGTAEYVGTARVERMGRYRAAIPRAEFDKLVKALGEARFFELNETYRGKVPGTNRPVTDAPGIVVTAVSDGKKKTVTDYGYGGPEGLRLLQRTILDSGKKLTWRKDERDSR